MPFYLLLFFSDEHPVDKSPSLPGFYAQSQHSSDSSLATKSETNLTVTDQSIKRYVLTLKHHVSNISTLQVEAHPFSMAYISKGHILV